MNENLPEAINYNGYGINLADLHEFNGSQLIISIHVGLIRINTNDRKKRSRSDWRDHRRL